MVRRLEVSDGPLCFPHTPPGVNVPEGKNNSGCCKSINDTYISYNCCTGLTIDSVELCWRYGPKESLHRLTSPVFSCEVSLTSELSQ